MKQNVNLKGIMMNRQKNLLNFIQMALNFNKF